MDFDSSLRAIPFDFHTKNKLDLPTVINIESLGNDSLDFVYLGNCLTKQQHVVHINCNIDRFPIDHTSKDTMVRL